MGCSNAIAKNVHDFSAIESNHAMLVVPMDIPPNVPMRPSPAMSPFPRPMRLPICEQKSINSSVV